MTWMWMSFLEPGVKHLGVCIVEIAPLIAAVGGAPAAAACVRESRARQCNPGGEVMMHPLAVIPPEEFRNRLMSPEEARAVSQAMTAWPAA